MVTIAADAMLDNTTNFFDCPNYKALFIPSMKDYKKSIAHVLGVDAPDRNAVKQEYANTVL